MQDQGDSEKPRRRPRMTKVKSEDVPRLIAAAKSLGVATDEALSISITLLEVFAEKQGSTEQRAREWADSFVTGRELAVPPPEPSVLTVRRHERTMLNVEEVAERLSTTVGHVRRLIREGRLPHVRVGRFLRVREEALASFINEAV